MFVYLKITIWILIVSVIIHLNEEFNSKPISTSQPRFFKDTHFNSVVGLFDGQAKDSFCAMG